MSHALPFSGADHHDEEKSTIPYLVSLELEVRDPDTVQELCKFGDEADRRRFALQALRIGVLALRQARGQVDGDKIRRESERLLENMDAKLVQHTQGLNDRLASILKDYFDPESGRFQERIDRLIKKDGDLEGMLRRQIGAEDSELRRTLTAHFGDDSKLMRMLNPNQSQGLMSAIRETLDAQLKTQREHVLNQFSLDNKQGALSRFIGELSENQGKLSDSLNGKIDEVVKEFSLDNDDSALSRLVRNVDRAQRTITNEFSLDEEASALSRLKRMMEDTNSTIHSHLSLDDDKSALARLKKELLSLLKDQTESNLKFQEEVKGSLNAMIVKRDEKKRSTRHGNEFETAVFEYLFHEAQKAGDIATATGNTTGQIKNCKVGDCVLELGPDNACAGSKIVIEAKQNASYDLAQARREIETARKNRDACVGVFIWSAQSAPPHLDALTRYGDDVFVVWDAEDASTDIFLKAGLTLARALCVRSSTTDAQEATDFAAIDQSVLEVEKQAGMLGEIDTWAGTIIRSGEKIQKRVATSRKSFDRQIDILREKVAHLKEIM